MTAISPLFKYDYLVKIVKQLHFGLSMTVCHKSRIFGILGAYNCDVDYKSCFYNS